MTGRERPRENDRGETNGRRRKRQRKSGKRQGREKGTHSKLSTKAVTKHHFHRGDRTKTIPSTKRHLIMCVCISLKLRDMKNVLIFRVNLYDLHI